MAYYLNVNLFIIHYTYLQVKLECVCARPLTKTSRHPRVSSRGALSYKMVYLLLTYGDKYTYLLCGRCHPNAGSKIVLIKLRFFVW